MIFDADFDYAWSAPAGYLTCCPTNVGTGMRASIMLHLPGLALSGQQSLVFGTISKVGIIVREYLAKVPKPKHISDFQSDYFRAKGRGDHQALNREDQVISQELEARNRLLETENIALRTKSGRLMEYWPTPG